MKNSVRVCTYFLVVCFLVCGISCKKEESKVATNPGSLSGELIIDGVQTAFVSNKVTLIKQGDTFIVTADNNNGKETVYFRINRLDGTGNYNVNWPSGLSKISADRTMPSDANLNYSSDNKNSVQQSGSGLVQVTSLLDDARVDNLIEGTLTITAYNGSGKTATFKQGKFSGSFTKE